MIRDFAKLIPKSLSNKSGAVFYSGKRAFKGQADLYILGINPGGDPRVQIDETVESHTRQVLNDKPVNWSEYRDESWSGYPPGTANLQPALLHFFRRLRLDPGVVPASNLVFLRSQSKRRLGSEKDFCRLAEICWPFHNAVLKKLKVRVIVCFRGADKFVRQKVDAYKLVDKNAKSFNRMERSYSYMNSAGLIVVVVPHPSPSYNDWTDPEVDPSCLVQREPLRVTR